MTRDPGEAASESIELRSLREQIDELDRRIVGLLNDRAKLTLDVGREKARIGRRGMRDTDREREVLLRIAMANSGPLPQLELLAIYRRLIRAAHALEVKERARDARQGFDATDDDAE